MYNRTLILRSAISGVIWAGIAVLMMWIVLGRYESVGDLVWSLRGGILVAPLVGIAAGLCSRIFEGLGFIGRVVVSLVTLYVAACLFMLASRFTAFAAGERQAEGAATFFDSVSLAFAGLTWTGLVLILGPLAYLNYLYIVRSVSVPEEQDAEMDG
jgi:hypothetical protein